MVLCCFRDANRHSNITTSTHELTMGLFRLLLRLVLYLVPVVEDIFGLVYPILATAKAVVQEDSEAASKWLTYWTVYSVFVIFEGTSEWLISWMPLYNECKLLFVCWLVLPRFEGAAKLYDRLVIPYFLEYEEQIDERLSEAGVEAKRHLSTFVMYLVTEGSKLAGEKSMAGVSLFLRLTGFSAVLGEKDQVNENTVYAVATVVGDVIQDHIPVAEIKEESKTSDKRIRSKSAKSSISKLRVDVAEEGLSGSKSERIQELSIEPMEVDMAEEKYNEEKYKEEEKEGGVDEGKVEDEEDEEEELVRAEEGRELLDDFLAVIEDGIYLNVSKADPDSSPRLRIVTLSGDRWRLLWSNLRQRGAASSLHLCTVL
jgi:hypothetical protein